MTQTSITTAGIDTSKAKLDIALHGRAERWQLANAMPGWRALAAKLTQAGVARVGIEASGGYERGVVAHLRAAGFSDRDIWDIANVTGFFNFSNRMAMAAGMTPNAQYHEMARAPEDKGQ